MEIERLCYVVIETNMGESNFLVNRLDDYRSDEIILPNIDTMEQIMGHLNKPTFWYRTGKDKPRRYGIYNSPKDTVGKNIVDFIPARKFKLKKSVLSQTINGFGEHYCVVVRQFVNQIEATKYIELIVSEGIIDKETIAFPIAKSEFKNLRGNFDKYSINN